MIIWYYLINGKGFISCDSPMLDDSREYTYTVLRHIYTKDYLGLTDSVRLIPELLPEE